MSDTAIRAWLAAYGRAWEEQDSDSLVLLFTPNALYVEDPFVEPLIGRQAIHRYWEEGAVRSQRDISFSSDLWCTFDDYAVAHWKAHFTRVSTSEHVELDGVFRLRFETADAGQIVCAELREWWFRTVPSVKE
jgi:ketosteroid isomerase-like protein